MNKREAAIISAYTGILIGDFGDMHKYVEEIMEGPVWTHQMGDKGFCEKIKDRAKPDFMEIHEAISDETV